ncbi:ABC transporter permease [bacterium]|nr:ABC transporter permease [bacterium]
MRTRSAWRGAIIAIFLIYMLVPLLATLLFSFATRWDRTILPEGLSIQWWKAVMAKRAFGMTLRNSLALSLATMLASIILVAPTAYWTHLRLPKARPYVELFTILPFGIPGVVLALALIRCYARFGAAVVYSPAMLVAACMVISLPFMYRPVLNALNAADVKVLTEAAQSLGAGWFRTMTRVIVPNIMSGIASGALLVFSTVFVEFTLANLLVGARFKTFPMYLVEFTRFDGRQASALAVISFVFAWLASIGVLLAAGRSEGAREGAAGAK